MKQRRNFFTRVLFCKIQCPSFSSHCKPSRDPCLYTSSPLKLENTQNAPNSNPVSVVSVTDDDVDEKANWESSDGNEENGDNALKSCIRKKDVEEKKKVQWVDNFGKELVEIKEFESSDTGDTDSELENKMCSCLILR